MQILFIMRSRSHQKKSFNFRLVEKRTWLASRRGRERGGRASIIRKAAPVGQLGELRAVVVAVVRDKLHQQYVNEATTTIAATPPFSGTYIRPPSPSPLGKQEMENLLKYSHISTLVSLNFFVCHAPAASLHAQ